MNLDLNSIKQTVQKNCHIADANAASDYTLCIYLMKMREYYRWEHGHNYGDTLPNSAVGEWLRTREHLWETLEEENFAPIPIEAGRAIAARRRVAAVRSRRAVGA